MLILALETSGEVCSVALWDTAKGEKGRERSAFSFRHERQLTERLPGIVQFVLSDQNLTLQQINGLAVGLGPGSFTGARVAVTMAKTWAWALQIPVVGLSSLDALAAPYAPLRTFAIAAVAPTRRHEVTVAFYAPGETSPVAPPEVLPSSEVARVLSERISPDIPRLVVGEAAREVQAQTGDERGTVFVVAASLATHIAQLAAPRLLTGDTDDTDTLVPLYVTPSSVGV